MAKQSKRCAATGLTVISQNGPDDALLNLGRQFEAQCAIVDECRQRSDEAHNEWEAFLDATPEVLRATWMRDKDMPFYWPSGGDAIPLVGPSVDDRNVFLDRTIEEIRTRWCTCEFADPSRTRKVRRRACEIVRAFDKWRPVRDALADKLRCYDLDQAEAVACEYLDRIEDAIGKASITTMEGLRVLAAVVHYESGDAADEDDPFEMRKCRLAELILQLVPPAMAVPIENADHLWKKPEPAVSPATNGA